VRFDEALWRRFQALQQPVEEERTWLDASAGGSANNPFHLCRSDSACAAAAKGKRPADDAWMIHCDVCNAVLKLGEEERPFNNFNHSHVLRPSHLGATLRRQAAGDGDAPPPATQGADGPSSSLAPAIEANEWELLLRDTPELVAQNIHAGCELCQHPFAHPTSDRRLLPAVRQHLASASHLEKLREKESNRSILDFFSTTAPQQQRAVPDLETLCWGLHEQGLKAGETLEIDLRAFVSEQPSNQYFTSEPGARYQYMRKREIIIVHGLLRSRDCARFAVDQRNRPLLLRTCDACAQLGMPSTPAGNSLRMKLKRRADLSLGADEAVARRKSCNYRHMPRDALLEISRTLRASLRQARWIEWQLRRKLVAAAARMRSLSERVQENARRGDINALVADIDKCERQGKWEQRHVLFDFLRDIIHSVALTDSESGQRSRNMRWHESTSRVFAVLKMIGGPKVNRFMHETLESASYRTIGRTIAQTAFHMPVGLSDDLFRELAQVLRNLMDALGVEKVLWQLSEDESTITRRVSWCPRIDGLHGYCGEAGEGHVCKEDSVVIVGPRAGAYAIIENAHLSMQLASYIRLVMINPLYPDLPKLAVLVHGTCNRFTAAWIKESWARLRVLVYKHVVPVIGPLVGHASDGDARRFAIQQGEMRMLPPGRVKYGLLVDGFTLFANWDGSDPLTVTGIHEQDPRHNLAKLYSQAASTSRTLQLGVYIVTHLHVILVAPAARDRGTPIGAVREVDLKREDRQVRRAAASRDARGAPCMPNSVRSPPHPCAVLCDWCRTRRRPPTAARCPCARR
jgi:hypothetical protein